MATLSHTPTDAGAQHPLTLLWKGAAATAFAAVLFPRVNAVLHDHERIWQLDHEAAVLAPLVVVIALVLFAAVGPFAWRGTGNRPATASVVCGALSVVGIVAFWMSVPIIFGGLAVTLGLEGRQRAAYAGRGRLATVGTALGALGVLAGAVLWLVGV